MKRFHVSRLSKKHHAWGLSLAAGLALAASPLILAAAPPTGGGGPNATPDSGSSLWGNSWSYSYAVGMASASSMTINGIFRDFRESQVNGGHPDFENQPVSGRGIYVGIAANALNNEGKPVFASVGTKLSTQALDSSNRPIIGSKPYLAPMGGDVPAQLTANSGAVEGSASFSSWFTDTPLVNYAAPFPLTFNRVGLEWVADADMTTQFASEQGFGGNKIYSFTYELDVNFVFNRAADDLMSFGADDAMWVFIDGKLVIDLGGDHDYAEQTIALNRINDLVDGKTYNLKVFYGERSRINSRIRISTTTRLSSVSMPQVAAVFD